MRTRTKPCSRVAWCRDIRLSALVWVQVVVERVKRVQEHVRAQGPSPAAEPHGAQVQRKRSVRRHDRAAKERVDLTADDKDAIIVRIPTAHLALYLQQNNQ